ncbi:hypothetical protein JTB14_028486 [Gonioctena quinquepunctata]|nr:hypothetical protein JTB14_028486 [Gonioctena quinquepunctata]
MDENYSPGADPSLQCMPGPSHGEIQIPNQKPRESKIINDNDEQMDNNEDQRHMQEARKQRVPPISKYARKKLDQRQERVFLSGICSLPRADLLEVLNTIFLSLGDDIARIPALNNFVIAKVEKKVQQNTINEPSGKRVEKEQFPSLPPTKGADPSLQCMPGPSHGEIQIPNQKPRESKIINDNDEQMDNNEDQRHMQEARKQRVPSISKYAREESWISGRESVLSGICSLPRADLLEVLNTIFLSLGDDIARIPALNNFVIAKVEKKVQQNTINEPSGKRVEKEQFPSLPPTKGCERRERYTCNNCSKSYTMVNNLKRHQRVECGKEKTLVCYICGKRVYYKQELETHLKLKHNVLLKRTGLIEFLKQKPTKFYSDDPVVKK